MPVPNSFANVTTSIPLSQLDANFNTPITLGNTAIQLGNTVTTLNNMTLANVTVTSGNVTLTNVTVTTANVTTANITTAVIGTANVTTANVTTANITTGIIATANVTTANITNLIVSGTGTFAAGSNTAPSITFSGDTNTGIFSPAADTIAFTEGGVESMRIDSSGNVGIGTSSLTEKFEVNGSINASTSSSANFSSGTQRAFMDYVPGSTTARFGHLSGASGSTSGVMAMLTNGTERARIDSSGHLLVGATGQIVTSYQSRFGVDIGTFNSNQGYVGIGVTTTSSADLMQFINPNGVVGRVITSGSSTSYATSSDYRLKEDVQPMTGALARVAALKPVTYKWKIDGVDGEGFIAHELAEVVPDAVTGEKDAVNEDGSIKPQGIDTSFLVATLTAAIQEQQQMIETLQAKVAALEGKK